MEKHCPLCGRPSSDLRFIGEICEPCIVKKLKSSLPSSVRIRACKFCGRTWSAGEFRDNKKISLAAAIRQGLGQKGCLVDVLSYDSESAKVRLTFEVDGRHAAFIEELGLERSYEMCRRCSRLKAGYYEAVVQFRGGARDAGRMSAALERFMGRRGAFVSKKVELKYGADVYVSDKKAASEFMLAWHLKPKRSYTLYGMKHGKKLYRNIYSVDLGEQRVR